MSKPVSRSSTRSASPGHFRHSASGGARGNPSLLYGFHAVVEAWTNPARRIRRLMVTPGALESFQKQVETGGVAARRPHPEQAEGRELDRLTGGAVHQGIVLDAEPLEEPTLEDLLISVEDRDASLLFLDHVTDPHNVGAILRSACAFGAAAVIATRHHAPEITGTLAKAASGAVEHIDYVRVPNLVRALETVMDAGFITIALDERGDKQLAEHGPFTRTAVVMGAEGEGLRRLTLDSVQFKAKLPTGGPIGSLNVSNAASVALYEVIRRA